MSGLVLAVGIATAGLSLAAQSKPQNYKGLEVSIGGVERASNVSLTDCPPGANIVRGVIKPGDPMEFASVKVDFKVTPAFKPGPLPKPVVQDAAGKTYNTAQSFAEVGATPSFSCTFSFRVPTGTELKKFTLDTVSIDLPASK
ncbi:MAG TPA: hypothetical protein VL263_19515 [Vicinamibacterales bacterium]|nr:hypothetical protein [Vicinamibacterales bacterium]